MDEKILNVFPQLFATRGDGKSLSRSVEFAKFLCLLGAIQIQEEYKRETSQLEPTLEKEQKNGRNKTNKKNIRIKSIIQGSSEYEN